VINRTSDIMKQGCMKRLPAPKGTAVSRRIKTLKTALAGKSGYQSPWAVDLMRQELVELTRK
jgi:hypothetical protein